MVPPPGGSGAATRMAVIRMADFGVIRMQGTMVCIHKVTPYMDLPCYIRPDHAILQNHGFALPPPGGTTAAAGGSA